MYYFEVLMTVMVSPSPLSPSFSPNPHARMPASASPQVRDETAETPSQTGARSLEGGKAYLKQYVD
jgi:hypothetical protein